MESTVSDWLAPLRNAAWLSGARAKAYARILGGLSLVLAVAWMALSHAGLDPSGKPLGTDFLSFWAASRLALDGHPAGAYDFAAHRAVQNAVFPGTDPGYFAFFYPPVYLLVCLPLALLSYTVALALWLGATACAYLRAMRGFLGRDRAMLLPAVAFPAVLITLGHGQNAFLVTALFGGAIQTLHKRPWVSGLLFGLLVFKPQLGLLIPIVLIATGAWATLASAAATVMALIGLSVAAFGLSSWTAFLNAAPLARTALEQDWVGPEKMQSAFAAVRLWHGSVAVAYGAQILVALLACGVLLDLIRRDKRAEAIGPALVCAALLATPFVLDYDTLLLAIPLAWVLAKARRTGFLPWEKAVLGAAFVMPLVSRLCAMDLGVPLGPPIILGVLVMVVRRGRLAAPQLGRDVAPKADAGQPLLSPLQSTS